MGKGPKYFDFIRYHEEAKSKVLRKEGASEDTIAAVDEEITKEERKKKALGKI